MINHTGTPLRIVEFMTVLAAATPAYATLSQEKSSNASRRFVDTCLQKYKKTWKIKRFVAKNFKKNPKDWILCEKLQSLQLKRKHFPPTE